MNQQSKPKKVQVATLGCSKNKVDSEHLMVQLERAGIAISPEGEDLSTAGVDTLIINTCGFIGDAKEESIQAILEGVEAKNQGHISQVLVWGCLSQRYREELIEAIPEVDRFFGAYDLDNILAYLGVEKNPLLLTQRYLTTPKHYAYLKISEGCDRQCSYCAIPGIRGRHISVPIEELVREAEFLASIGVKELILIAQDTTYYGLDIYRKRALAQLIERLEAIKGIEWIRIHYSYPASFPDDVLEIMAHSPKVCKYMDIPLQHSADKVLAAMRRNIDGKQTRALVERMREKVPGIVLRTTMIVGHPGEGKREFQDLLNFVQEYKFERLGAFTYSEEEGTWGAENLKDTIRKGIKQERYEELMELQSGISLEFNNSRVGSVERVLVDSFTDGVYVARTSKESPEVDGEVLLGGEFDPARIGTFADAMITRANEYDLLGEFIK
ncbi:MAG: 30S ribosomal protein S12 methylthiotransferase RimO [Bacteroidales bacterium]|nr:30S ribosomal protein S12 methylthiotransferase RimO [Bacteroidales bacterium]